MVFFFNTNGCVNSINLTGRGLTGTLPVDIRNLQNLESLVLTNNDLTGNIPEELNNLNQLRFLDLGNNLFSGSIPRSLGSIQSLEKIWIYSNSNLTGGIPKELGNLSKLQELHLWGNTNLGGVIPVELANLSSLTILDLQGNGLTGVVPNDLNKLTNLELLILSNNQLTGEIPGSLAELPALRTLYLNGNQLSGCFNESLKNLCNRVTFSFEDNAKLPWSGSEYDVIESWCKDKSQLEAKCDDGNPDTFNDSIQSDCSCEGRTNISCQNQATFSVDNTSGCLPLTVEFSDLSSVSETPIVNWEWIYGDGNASSFSQGAPHSYTFTETGTFQTYLVTTNELGCTDTSDIIEFIIFNENCEEVLSCRTRDSSALAALYYATDGDNWKNNDNWLSNLPLSDWYGVETNNDGCVVSLSLRQNMLYGKIPSEIGNLPNLVILDLGFNQLTGCFTQELSDLCNIQFYDFSNNPGLPWGGDFWRWCNEESQIGAPCDDGNPQTKNDKVSDDCECKGEVIETCRSRDSLALVALYNATDGDNWKNNENWLSTQPLEDWYGIRTSMEGCVTDLILSSNNLNGELPKALSNLEILKALRLGDNKKITGSIPKELGNLNNLEWIDLSENSMTGEIPKELGNLNNLKWLFLYRNALTGSIPKEIGNLNNLSGFLLSNNNLTGGIPKELENLNNVSSLSFAGNDLTGSIPKELGNLTNLKGFDFRSNSLTGSIPKELGNLNSLTGLYLSGNNLTGSIPKELGNLSNLEQIDLSDNNLSGCFPLELMKICDLGSAPAAISNGYRFKNNPLLPWNGNMERWCDDESQIGAPCDDGNPDTTSDKITEECKCKGEIIESCRARDSSALTALYFSTNGDNWEKKDNWLSSQPLSKWYGVRTDDNGCVVSLDLANNNFSGEISDELGNLTNLEGLDLFGNNLSGEIPDRLGDLTSLKSLDLGSNNLSGEIPDRLGDLTNLEDLDLGSNNLSGEILDKLGDLTNLEDLNLGSNNLSGEIPDRLGNLTNLNGLDLSYNNLSGCLSDDLISFCDVAFLYLDNNPSLPWEGYINSWCEGMSQIGVFCDDGDEKTDYDKIREDCSCRGCTTQIVEIQQFICSGENYQLGNKILTQEGIYSDTTISIYGCDSIIFLDLQVIEPSEFSITDTLCDGESIIINSIVYNQENLIGLQTLTNANGCDSIIRVNLTYSTDFEVANAGIDTTICTRDYMLNANLPDYVNGEWRSTSPSITLNTFNNQSAEVTNLVAGENKFTWTLSHSKCPDYSTDDITINVVENPTPVAKDKFFLMGSDEILKDTLTSENNNWMITNIANPSHGILEIEQGNLFTYEPDIGFNGDDFFGYTICNNICLDSCATAIVRVGVGEIDNDDIIEYFDLFPNPNEGTFTLNIQALRNANLEIQVFNILGQLVFTKQSNQSGGDLTILRGDNSVPIELSFQEKGIYFLSFVVNGESVKTAKAFQNGTLNGLDLKQSRYIKFILK